MKPKLLKIIELLKEPKAYNNIQYILGMLETMVIDIEGEKKTLTTRSLFKK